jgi:putative transposase
LLTRVENRDAESILGESGLAGQLKKMLAERMLSAELKLHLRGRDPSAATTRWAIATARP